MPNWYEGLAWVDPLHGGRVVGVVRRDRPRRKWDVGELTHEGGYNILLTTELLSTAAERALVYANWMEEKDV